MAEFAFYTLESQYGFGPTWRKDGGYELRACTTRGRTEICVASEYGAVRCLCVDADTGLVRLVIGQYLRQIGVSIPAMASSQSGSFGHSVVAWDELIASAIENDPVMREMVLAL
ncbi:MAG: hypothetical protein ABL962_09405 [Fimbriimonadaceae bacterium]